MALPSVTYTLDTVASTSLHSVRPRLADNIFRANPLVFWLLSNGRVQLESGGKWIEEPLEYATNPTLKSYTGWEELNVAATDEVTAARYGWRQFAGAVAYSGLEDIINAGEAQVLNSLKIKIRNLERSARQWLNEKLHALDANKDLNKDFLGLPQLIPDNDGAAMSPWNTVGGINRANETWWQTQYHFDGSSSGYGSKANPREGFDRLLYLTSKGITKPDLLLMDWVTFHQYEEEAWAKGVLQLTDTRLLDVGFMNFRYKGVTMMWDEEIDTARASSTHKQITYAINTEFMRVVLHRRRNFMMTPFVRPYNQDGRVAQMLTAGNLTLNNSRFQGCWNPNA